MQVNNDLGWLNLAFNTLPSTVSGLPEVLSAYAQLINVCVVYGGVLLLHYLLFRAWRHVGKLRCAVTWMHPM